METYPKVAIVLVNWNGLNDTLECLGSLAHVTYPRVEVIVVDNGSKINESSSIREAYPNVDVIRSETNLGFTGGNNVGINRAMEQGADYVLCLNNDTVVAPDFLDIMVKAIEADPQAGIVTASVYEFENSERLMVSGCSVNFAASPPVVQNPPPASDILQGKSVIRVQFAEGCVLMMRRKVVELTHGFDDNFFAYLEDADLCLRAGAENWHCILATEARIWHKVGRKGAGYMSPTSVYYAYRNSRRLVRKHGTRHEQKLYNAVERSSLVGGWKKVFKDVARSGETPKSYMQDYLVPQTVGIMMGLLNISGNKNKSINLYNFLKTTALFFGNFVMCLGTASKPAVQFYKLVRQNNR